MLGHMCVQLPICYQMFDMTMSMTWGSTGRTPSMGWETICVCHLLRNTTALRKVIHISLHFINGDSFHIVSPKTTSPGLLHDQSASRTSTQRAKPSGAYGVGSRAAGEIEQGPEKQLVRLSHYFPQAKLWHNPFSCLSLGTWALWTQCCTG